MVAKAGVKGLGNGLGHWLAIDQVLIQRNAKPGPVRARATVEQRGARQSVEQRQQIEQSQQRFGRGRAGASGRLQATGNTVKHDNCLSVLVSHWKAIISLYKPYKKPI